jgi:hypothetical protein
MRPCNSSNADVRAVLDKSPSREPVKIEFQSVLQAKAVVRSWHERLQVEPGNNHSRLAGKI